MEVLSAISPANPTDLIWVVAITAICTTIAFTLFVNSFVNFESRFVGWFSNITSSPRWFTVWILVMILWVPLRHLLIERGQLRPDADFVVATLLWSGVPFMVENLLKSTSARQMKILTELVIAIRTEVGHSAARDEALTELALDIKQEVDRSAERDSMLHALVNRLLEAIGYQTEEGR